MQAKELKKRYLEFFKKKKHAIINSAPLIPENDPTTLFINAGMQPIVKYLAGQEHPSGKRLVSVQKCLRTRDIDEVGHASHTTFFEMLGNWSLGDYFKKEAKVSRESLIILPKKFCALCAKKLSKTTPLLNLLETTQGSLKRGFNLLRVPLKINLSIEVLLDS